MNKKLKPGVTYQSIVGEVLVQARKSKKMTQGELADRIGLSQSAWSRVEKGLTNLSVEQLVKAAANLDIPPYRLIQQADQTRWDLESSGITVLDSQPSNNTGWLLLGAAALTAIVIAASSR